MSNETTAMRVPTAIGEVTLMARDGALSAVYLPGEPVPPAPPGRAEPLPLAAEQLTAWLAGERRDFDLPLHDGGTAFERRVWQELAAIPYGRTVTYGELAARIGRPEAPRAVGAAVGRNPLPVVVPCHRVVGAGGRLTGFRAGLEHKRRLLDLEAGALGIPLDDAR